MNRDEVKRFLVEIVGIYPKFQLMEGTIDAWTSRLGGCSPERGRELLDKWINSDDSKYPPQLDYFVKGTNPIKIKYTESDEELKFHVGLRDDEVPPGCTHKYLGQGCLFDQYGREYGSPYTDKPYYYDEMGRLCNGLGQVIE